MVIFHSYVSLPEGKRALFWICPSHCVKLSVPELVEHQISGAFFLSTAPKRSTQTTLEWVRERINPNFAEYLEARSLRSSEVRL